MALNRIGPPVAAEGSRYELISKIASGGMGTVYLGRARDAGAGAPKVAIKVMHPHLVDDPKMVAMFLDEARVSMRIHHPNVVEVVDVDRDGDDLFIAMQYVEGLPLHKLLDALVSRQLPLSMGAVARILVDALEGLHAAHETRGEDGQPLNIVHRDFSPQNLLVGSDGLTRVTDFGIAHYAGRLAQTGASNVVKGKVPYLAPEQINGKAIDRRVDVFAAGSLLWEMLVGRRLFLARTEAETMAAVVRQTIDPPSKVRPDVPQAMDEACLRALEREPSRRHMSAQAMAIALRQAVGDGLATPAEVGALVESVGDAALKRRAAPHEPTTRTLFYPELGTPRTRRLLVAGACLGLGTVLAGAIFFTRSSSGSPEEGSATPERNEPRGAEVAAVPPPPVNANDTVMEFPSAPPPAGQVIEVDDPRRPQSSPRRTAPAAAKPAAAPAPAGTPRPKGGRGSYMPPEL